MNGMILYLSENHNKVCVGILLLLFFNKHCSTRGAYSRFGDFVSLHKVFVSADEDIVPLIIAQHVQCPGKDSCTSDMHHLLAIHPSTIRLCHLDCNITIG